jgi:ABC-type transport system substrate-binding protein
VGGENYGALVDPTLDRLLEAVRTEPDADKRAGLQHRVHRRLHELQPYTFIVSDSRVGLMRRGLGGVRAGSGLSARFLWRERAE